MNDIAKIRQFNRTVTHHIGALENEFLGRERSLGASRLLFEIGAGAEVRVLRERLGLDSGYVSRLLRTLEHQGLVQLGSLKEDARVRFVSLTPKGVKEVALLDKLSDRGAAAMLEPLSEKQRASLVESMATVERLLRASSINLATSDPGSRLAQQCLTHYYEELSERFEMAFDPSVSISAAPEELRPPQGYFVLALLQGEAVGCGALKCHTDFGEIKRMWVAASCRGMGIGRRILAQLEFLARERGLALLRLETNKALLEAQALYKSFGYQEVAPFSEEPYAHHWFEKEL
ncbi:MAG: MarR family transcriptional regulator [Trueperaceae bacterium]|nr:MarR family transcriptional regulator [Trueperaceae bacterium]